MELNVRTFFKYFIFHPFSKELPNKKQKAIAFVSTLALGVFVGVAHLISRVFFYERNVREIKLEERYKHGSATMIEHSARSVARSSKQANVFTIPGEIPINSSSSSEGKSSSSTKTSSSSGGTSSVSQEEFSASSSTVPFEEHLEKAGNDPDFSLRFHAENFSEEERYELADAALRAFPYQFLENIENFELTKEQLLDLGGDLFDALPGCLLEYSHKFPIENEDLKAQAHEFRREYRVVFNKCARFRGKYWTSKFTASFNDLKELADFLTKYPGAGLKLQPAARAVMLNILQKHPESTNAVRELVEGIPEGVLFPPLPTPEEMAQYNQTY